EKDSAGTVRARMLNVTVHLDRRTKVRGPELPASPGTAAMNPASGGVPKSRKEERPEDPFTPAPLPSGQAPSIEQHVFALAKDPGELSNVFAVEPERTAELRDKVFRWLERMQKSPRIHEDVRKDLDPATIERLRALGYVR